MFLLQFADPLAMVMVVGKEELFIRQKRLFDCFSLRRDLVNQISLEDFRCCVLYFCDGRMNDLLMLFFAPSG